MFRSPLAQSPIQDLGRDFAATAHGAEGFRKFLPAAGPLPPVPMTPRGNLPAKSGTGSAAIEPMKAASRLLR